MTDLSAPFYFFVDNVNGYSADINVHTFDENPSMIFKVFREENEFGYVNEDVYIQSGQAFFNQDGDFLPPRCIRYREKQWNNDTKVEEYVWATQQDQPLEPSHEEAVVAYYKNMFDLVYTPEVRERIIQSIRKALKEGIVDE